MNAHEVTNFLLSLPPIGDYGLDEPSAKALKQARDRFIQERIGARVTPMPPADALARWAAVEQKFADAFKNDPEIRAKLGLPQPRSTAASFIQNSGNS